MNKNFDDTTGRKKFFDNVNKELNKLIDPATGKVRAEMLEHVNCPNCDANSYEHLFEKQGFDFVRCKECTQVYVNPRLLESATLAYYGDAPDQQSMVDWLTCLPTPSINPADPLFSGSRGCHRQTDSRKRKNFGYRLLHRLVHGDRPEIRL